MGVRLWLRATHETSAPHLIERSASFLSSYAHDPPLVIERIDEPGRPALAIEAHPAAQAIVLRADERSLSLDAHTATAGPGMHRFTCRLARELGAALGVEWAQVKDDSQYFLTKNEARLEATVLEWLQGAAAEILGRRGEGSGGFSLAMPEGWSFEHDGLVATPLGPRDAKWVRAVAADPRAGTDVFAWWGLAGDARYYRDLARVLMWREVRWRAPLDDGERALLDRIATYVEKAFGLDPSLELPWPEQAEILELLGEQSLRATRAQVKAHARGVVADRGSDRIGYRRRPVRVMLSGGFSLEVPGELAERWDERGTWVAWDRERSIWFTSLRAQPEPGRPPPTSADTLASLPPLESQDALELERGSILGLAAFGETEEDGKPLYRLDAHAAVGGDAAVGTIVFARPEDREWALGVWGSIDHKAD